MNPMKSITAHSLFISLTLAAGYLTPVKAVTDAKLEALGKQIELQEAEAEKKLYCIDGFSVPQTSHRCVTVINTKRDT